MGVHLGYVIEKISYFVTRPETAALSLLGEVIDYRD
jgi:hypothetical protein